MAKRFGTFRDFLKKNDDRINPVRKPQLEKIIKEHYDKYGSSDESWDENDDKLQIIKDRSQYSKNISTI